MRVIDGMHRLRAALLNGQDTIEVRFFEGTDDEAFIAAVKANTAHGLPLSLADREAAAARIVASYPNWSDRAIAQIAGLSGKTVGAIRHRRGTTAADVQAKIGVDGRFYPVNAAERRQIAKEFIANHPDASLREIARAVGISPSTARNIRKSVHYATGQAIPDGQENNDRKGSRLLGRRRPAAEDKTSLLGRLSRDPSLCYTDKGRVFLRWLHERAIGAEKWQQFAHAVPPHCAFVLADLARNCANEWLEFAEHLDERARTSS